MQDTRNCRQLTCVALVNGEQHFFLFFVRVLDGDCSFSFFLIVVRLVFTAISQARVPIFFGAVKIRSSYLLVFNRIPTPSCASS